MADPRARAAWVALAGLACLVATLFAYRSAEKSDLEVEHSSFEARRSRCEISLQEHLNRLDGALYAGRGLFGASETVERREWEAFAQAMSLAASYPALITLEYIEYVPSDDSATYEKQVSEREKQELPPDFKVWKGPGAIPRKELAVVLYAHAEPERPQAKELGLDLASDPRQWAALERSLKTGAPAMTEGMLLPSEKGGGQHVAVYLPLWRKGPEPATERERQASILGWIGIEIRIAELVRVAVAPQQGVTLEAFDGERVDPGRRLTPDAAEGPEVDGEGPRRMRSGPRPLDFDGRRWTVQWSTPRGIGETSSHRYTVLGFGLVLTGLVTTVLWLLARTRTRAERLARRMADSLLAGEARLRSTLATVPDGLVVADETGMIRIFNPAAKRLFGWAPDEILGRDVRMLFAAKDPDAVDALFGLGAAAGSASSGRPAREAEARRKDGSTFTAEVHVSEMTVEGRRSVTALFHDVTERRRADDERRAHLAELERTHARIVRQTEALAGQAKELADARDQAMAAGRVKGDFLAAVSHEIRTPLNGVLGMTHLLLESGLSGEQEEQARAIKSSAEGLLAILNDILDLSKIEAGKLALEPVPFDLRVACEEVLDLLAPQADAKAVELVLRWAPGTPSRVVGDAGRVRQVLVNLVSNAIKFTEAGHVLVDVRGTKTDGDRLRVDVRVEDTGIGIPEEKLPLLFRRFSQADSSTTRRFGGTGLGLVICKLLVDRMGGTIGVESRPGEGSTFSFSLVLPLDAGAPPDPTPPAALSKERVLVADDAPVNRRVVRELAESWGVRVEEASSGSQAIEALRRARREEDPFRIAVLDLHMDGLDGIDVAKAVRADPGLRDTRLLLLSGSTRRGGAAQAEEAGFDAFLAKPVKANDLREAFVALVSRKPARGPLLTRHRLAEARRATHVPPPAPAPDSALRERRRVLLAEDNAVNQKVAVKMLERLNCSVDVAANGREAVEMVGRFPYDLVFMDVQMPEMDGYAATVEIRKQEAAGRRVPVLAMTANAMEADRARCLESGMDDHLAKPVSAEDLRRAVLRWAATPASSGASAPSPAGGKSSEASKAD